MHYCQTRPIIVYQRTLFWNKSSFVRTANSFYYIRGERENCVILHHANVFIVVQYGHNDKVYGTSGTYISQIIPEVH